MKEDITHARSSPCFCLAVGYLRAGSVSDDHQVQNTEIQMRNVQQATGEDAATLSNKEIMMVVVAHTGVVDDIL